MLSKCFKFHQRIHLFIYNILLGGWQDGATAVCVWVLGQKVSLQPLSNLSLPLLFKAEPIVKKVPSRFSLFL